MKIRCGLDKNMRTLLGIGLYGLSILMGGLGLAPAVAGDAPDIGMRRELFVDDYLIGRMDGCELKMHHPVKREIVMTFDKPWEGNACGYATSIFSDGDRYHMYYLSRGFEWSDGGFKKLHPAYLAYATSKNGIDWVRPELEFKRFGGKKTNILGHALYAFYDTNPKCSKDAKFKGVLCHEASGAPEGVKDRANWGQVEFFKSPDGVHWTSVSEKPLTVHGRLDSHNIAFYDKHRGEYRFYFRSFKATPSLPNPNGVRDIKVLTSKDFINWGEFSKKGKVEYIDGEFLEYEDNHAVHLYTNAIGAYHRAPHLYIGMPMRYVSTNQNVPKYTGLNNIWRRYHDFLPEKESRKARSASGHGGRLGTARSDTLLMTSRDGRQFKRWPEAFIKPGPYNWTYADNCAAWHIVETRGSEPGVERELSIYASEGFWVGDTSQLRRYSLRLDGFVSVHTDTWDEAELLTRPILFDGKALEVNYATTAAGWVRIEVQDADGNAIPGFTVREFHNLVGDQVDRVVSWNGGIDLSKLAGKPIRLRFVMREADLYSIRFRPDIPEAYKDLVEDSFYPPEEGRLLPTHQQCAGQLLSSSLASLDEKYSKKKPSGKKLGAELKARFNKILAQAPLTNTKYIEQVREFGRKVTGYCASVPRAEKAPALDGALDDTAWKNAAELPLMNFNAKTGESKAPSVPSTLKLCYDAENLYIGFEAVEKDLEKVIAVTQATEHDSNEIWKDDSLEVNLRALGAEAVGKIWVNAAGAVVDMRDGDMSWDSNARVASAKDPDKICWKIEVALPWKDLDINADKGLILRGNFIRANIANHKKVTGKPRWEGREYNFWSFEVQPGGHGVLVLE